MKNEMSEKEEKKKEKKNKFKHQVYFCLSFSLFSSVSTNKYQRTATIKHKENVNQHADALKDMNYILHVIVNHY